MIAPTLLTGLVLIGFIRAATIGDGLTSLIDGKPIANRSSGSCIVEGKTYLSETSVPRDHPCHYCICYGGKIDCFWKQCAHIPDGCQVMAFQDTCNPSLYICDIPEKAREAPTYGLPSAIRQQPTLNVLASTTVYTTSLATAPTSAPNPPPTRPSSVVQTYTKPEVVPPSRHLIPPARQLIEPPSRHLTPPLPLVAPQKKSISVSSLPVQQSSRQKRPLDEISINRQPAQFGLGMKNKMRFSRSLADITSILDTMLPHSIQEEFPLNFDHEIVTRFIERKIRSKRSINNLAGENHHHHHHDHHEEDRGCTILGIHYHLGEVIGVATDVCRECRCAAQSLFCSPKCCFKPAPLEQVTGEFIRFLDQSPAPLSGLQAPQHPLHYIKSEFD